MPIAIVIPSKHLFSTNNFPPAIATLLSQTLSTPVLPLQKEEPVKEPSTFFNSSLLNVLKLKSYFSASSKKHGSFLFKSIDTKVSTHSIEIP